MVRRADKRKNDEDVDQVADSRPTDLLAASRWRAESDTQRSDDLRAERSYWGPSVCFFVFPSGASTPRRRRALNRRMMRPPGAVGPGASACEVVRRSIPSGDADPFKAARALRNMSWDWGDCGDDDDDEEGGGREGWTRIMMRRREEGEVGRRRRGGGRRGRSDQPQPAAGPASGITRSVGSLR